MKRKHLLSIIPLLKNFPDFYYRNNLRKMLVSISYDSLSRNALRCGIDAKVRSKNCLSVFLMIPLAGTLSDAESMQR